MKYINETFVIAGLISIFGAIVHATNQYKLRRSYDRPMAFIDWLILLPINIFSALMFGLAASLITQDPIHLFIACGTGAFLGVTGLNALTQHVLTFLLNFKKS